MRIYWTTLCLSIFASCGSSGERSVEDTVTFVGLTPGRGLFTTYNAAQAQIGHFSGSIASVVLSNQDLVCGDTNNRQYGGESDLFFLTFASYVAANPNLFFYRAGTFSCPDGRTIDADGEGHTAGGLIWANNKLSKCVSGTITISDLSVSQLTATYDVTMDDNQIYKGKVTVPYCAAESE